MAARRGGGRTREFFPWGARSAGNVRLPNRVEWLKEHPYQLREEDLPLLERACWLTVERNYPTRIAELPDERYENLTVLISARRLLALVEAVKEQGSKGAEGQGG